MDINIITFGKIIDIIGSNQMTVTNIPDTNTLISYLHQRFPVLAELQYRIAVDKDIIEGNTKLADQSTVALLPPFSGG